jgi:hypothetical protein
MSQARLTAARETGLKAVDETKLAERRLEGWDSLGLAESAGIRPSAPPAVETDSSRTNHPIAHLSPTHALELLA